MEFWPQQKKYGCRFGPLNLSLCCQNSSRSHPSSLFFSCLVLRWDCFSCFVRWSLVIQPMSSLFFCCCFACPLRSANKQIFGCPYLKKGQEWNFWSGMVAISSFPLWTNARVLSDGLAMAAEGLIYFDQKKNQSQMHPCSGGHLHILQHAHSIGNSPTFAHKLRKEVI